MFFENDTIKLYNGDCLDVIKKLSDKSINFIYFNPPFGTTNCDYDKPLNWTELWTELWRVLKKDGCIAIHSSQPFTFDLICSQRKNLKYVWYWNKLCVPTGHLFAKHQPMRMIEEICIFYKKKGTYNPQMIKRENDLIKEERPNTSHYYGKKMKKTVEGKTYTHRYPTHLLEFKRRHHSFSTRPDDLIDYFIKTYSNENDTILDLTCSDGQTMLGCKRLKRKYIGVDLDINMLKLCKDRFEKL